MNIILFKIKDMQVCELILLAAYKRSTVYFLYIFYKNIWHLNKLYAQIYIIDITFC